jgi:hypothetical protein
MDASLGSMQLGGCWQSQSLVDAIQVRKVEAVSQSKSNIVWIYSTVYAGYTWSPLTWSTTLATLGAHSPSTALLLATLGAHSPTVLHWLHLEPTHLLYYTGYT